MWVGGSGLARAPNDPPAPLVTKQYLPRVRVGYVRLFEVASRVGGVGRCVVWMGGGLRVA